MEDLQARAEESQRNSEAESAAVRRSLWGEDVAKQSAEDEMRTTILGDVTHPAPVVISPPQQPNNMLPLAMLALAAAIPATGAAGVIGYLLASKPEATAPISQDFEDGSVQIGLGRIEDYIKEESK